MSKDDDDDVVVVDRSDIKKLQEHSLDFVL